MFAVFQKLQGISDAAAPSIWKKHGPELIQILDTAQSADVPTQHFPSDGSYMKSTQVTLLCKLFDLDPPGPILKEVWGSLDTVVVHRNDIAHGTLPADDVGRGYSRDDLLAISYLWKVRWTEFLNAAEGKAAARTFYRRLR